MKIGFLSMPYVGHLNPMTALARRLKSRGHEVVLIGVPDAEPFARSAGLDFVPFCEKEFPAGSVPKLFAPVSKRHGFEVVRDTLQGTSVEIFRAASENLPQALVDSRVQGLVIDTIHSFIHLVPMSMGLPYVHVWNVLHMDFSGTTPPCLFGWPHETTPEAQARNAEGVRMSLEAFAPLMQAAMSYASKIGLQIDWSQAAATMSKLAIITQTPREFDFSGIPWPAHFHYAGPFHDDEGRSPIPFPWQKLTGQPLVYASLGTLVNGLEQVYHTILQAVNQLPEIQVALSVGKNVDLARLGPIPPNVIVVRSAPQLELLKRASLCITHAGLNTTLECLREGVPMVAIPIAYDQPGVAARIAHHRVGEVIELGHLTVEQLHGTIRKILGSPAYRVKARYFQNVIEQRRGLDMAAEVVERAFQNRQSAAERNEVALSHA